MGKNVAIVLAAGVGKRMQAKTAKQYIELEGKPIVWYSLNAFNQSPLVDEIVMVVGADEIEFVRSNLVEKYDFGKVKAVVEGGAERYLSVWEGLKAVGEASSSARSADGEQCEGSADHSYIMIHDGVRPFVTEEIISSTLAAAKEYGACVAAMPVKDTVKISDEEGFAIQTPNRKTVWAVQTPQVFEKELIVKAYGSLVDGLEELQAQGVEITDDAMVVEYMTGQKVKLVPASYKNIKITTPEDLNIARSFLA